MNSPRENPYAPPKAVVSDAAEPPRVRPRAVKIAVVLLWVELCLAVVNPFLTSNLVTLGTREADYKLFSEIFILIMIAISAWINIKVWQGRNWARIVALVLTLLAFPTLLALPEMFREEALSATVSLAALALDVVAMILVFGPGRDWFRRRS
jgi:uncharacterized membrane protein YagU involved in acid resistance